LLVVTTGISTVMGVAGVIMGWFVG
jgi:hypothetical protein